LEESERVESEEESGEQPEEESTNTEQKLASNPILKLDSAIPVHKHNSYLNFWKAAEVMTKTKMVDCNLAGRERDA